MTVELLVMRHAKSAWDTGNTDFDRPLAPRGEGAGPRMAEWLIETELVPDYVLSSGAARARSTAQFVIDACGIDRTRYEFRRDLYTATVEDWLAELRSHDRAHAGRILICGHNPTFDDLVLELSSTMPAFTDSAKLMTTAAIAHLSFAGDWPDVAPRSGRLMQLVRPRELG